MMQFLKSPGKARTDIDELSLFEQRINLLNGYVILMQLIRIWIPPNIGDHYLVLLFSLLMESSVFLATCHRAFGSLVIAGIRQGQNLIFLNFRLFWHNISFRVAYIRCHNFLQYIGVRRVVSVSKWLGFVVSLILTLGHTFEYVFLGKVSDLVYCSYFTKLNTKLAEVTAYFDYIASMSWFVSNLAEVLLFVIIIYELLKLHLNRVRLGMPRHAKKNVITATGHFLSWVIEFLLFGVLNMIAHASEDALDLSVWIFIMLFPSMNYAIFPTIQTLTSPDLRHHVFGQMSCTCCKHNGRGQSVHAAAEEIELGVLSNGNVVHQV